jgi:hypothetical protein
MRRRSVRKRQLDIRNHLSLDISYNTILDWRAPDTKVCASNQFLGTDSIATRRTVKAINKHGLAQGVWSLRCTIANIVAGLRSATNRKRAEKLSATGKIKRRRESDELDLLGDIWIGIMIVGQREWTGRLHRLTTNGGRNKVICESR